MDVEEKCFCECGSISKNVDSFKLICFPLIKLFIRKNCFKKLLKFISKILNFVVLFILETPRNAFINFTRRGVHLLLHQPFKALFSWTVNRVLCNIVCWFKRVASAILFLADSFPRWSFVQYSLFYRQLLANRDVAFTPLGRIVHPGKPTHSSNCQNLHFSRETISLHFIPDM